MFEREYKRLEVLYAAQEAAQVAATRAASAIEEYERNLAHGLQERAATGEDMAPWPEWTRDLMSLYPVEG